MVNVAVSGWSGVGSTTVTLILALALKRKYVYIGSVFRYLGMQLGYANEGVARLEADRLLERSIGKLMDRYVDWVLLNEENVILESDLSTFRIGKQERVFSVFLKAGVEARAARVSKDSRGENAVEILRSRDAEHKVLYEELWGIDYFDDGLISGNYWEVVESGELNLEKTLFEVLGRMRKFPHLASQYDWADVEAQMPMWIGVFDKLGKDGLRSELEKQGLMVDFEQILRQVKSMFGRELEQLPLEVRELFNYE